MDTGGTQVVADVGFYALGQFADRIVLPEAMAAMIRWAGERASVHDQGKVLMHAMLMLAGGGESGADIEHSRLQDRLFGDVCSGTTIRAITPTVLADLVKATDGVRAGMCRAWPQPQGTIGVRQ